jgi:hypothetical protein
MHVFIFVAAEGEDGQDCRFHRQRHTKSIATKVVFWGGSLTNDNVGRPHPDIKDFILIAPFLGGAIAVSFDVGFFWGLNFRFFTLFTLSDHINFALGALPLALFTSIGVVLISIGASRGYWPPSFMKTNIWRVSAVLSAAVFSVASQAVALSTTWGKNSLGIGLSMLFITLGVAAYWYEELKTSQAMLLSYYCVLVLIAAFLVGTTLGAGRSHWQTADTIETADSQVVGRVIRSGDKGILADLPVNFHPAAIRASAVDTPIGAV